MSKQQIEFRGKTEEAEEVEFEVQREGWSSYTLADGTEVKVKHVVARVFRLCETRKDDGTPIYIFQGSNVVATISANDLTKVKEPEEIEETEEPEA